MYVRLIRSMATSRFAWLHLLIVTLCACGSPAVRDHAQDASGSVTSTTIASTQTGFTYPLDIYLPASYADGSKTYPVIYATDGDAGFPPDGRFENFKRILQRRGIDAILVGIGGTTRRDRDFVLPGAVAYHRFLTQELIPFVETHFRADPKRRILSGISLGGAFVVTSLFLEASDTLYFSDYISAEGSFFLPSFLALEQKFAEVVGPTKIPATLILARGAASNKMQEQQFAVAGGAKSIPAMAGLSRGFSEATNNREVDSFYRRMQSRHYPDLVLIETSFPTDHIGADNPSFADAMARIFK